MKPYAKRLVSGAQMELFDLKKNRGRKSHDRVPLNNPRSVGIKEGSVDM
jgi:hypothetical protein